MPIYEYQCPDCGHRFEKLQKMSARKVRTCPECGGKNVERLVSAPAIQFKGTGWYVTDYSDKGKASEKQAKAEKSDSDKKSSDKSDKKDGAKGADSAAKKDSSKSAAKGADSKKSKKDS